jgi:hypothetical protein
VLPVPPKPFPCQAFRSLGLSGAGGCALALPLPPPRWRLSFSYRPAFRLAVPPGSVLGCCPWLPLPLDTVFWFSGGVSPGLALGRCGAVRGGAGADSRARFFI